MIGDHKIKAIPSQGISYYHDREVENDEMGHRAVTRESYRKLQKSRLTGCTRGVVRHKVGRP